jgi:hypothetical protein
MTFDTTAETEVMEDETAPLCGDRRNQLVNGITGALADAADGGLYARKLIGEALLLDPSIIVDVAMALEISANGWSQASNRRKTLNTNLNRACRHHQISPPYRVAKASTYGRSGRKCRTRGNYILERREVVYETEEYRRVTIAVVAVNKFHREPRVKAALVAAGWTPPPSIGDSK